ncbi:hypothetical protein H8E88_09925 [candidate division KSB1 bacterium]|nr:hypothetical protein [candidate division KSB1 bacterium]
MRRIKKISKLSITIFVCILFAFTSLLSNQENEQWNIFINKQLQNDEAIKVVLSDLQKAGLELTIFDDTKEITGNSIIIGSEKRNKLTSKLAKQNKIKLSGVENEQGYEIVTKNIDGNKVMVISGGSLTGDVYGLYWLWDRLRVFKELPDINVKREPELKIRFTGGGNKEAIRNALRYGATWVSGGPSVNHLVPWTVEPEKSNNAKSREKIRELINYAHSLHLKFLVYEDEFSYHPSLLKEFGAKPTPSDPAFWDAVQAKYRRLFQALPEIDGVRIRTGESTRVGGNFRALDVMHEGEGCDWSLAKRYRTYVKKMYTVVVGEFDKIYFQRTWVTSAHEQHSMADVYKEIFTDDVPVRNLYMSPYLSTTDRYFHQPYNPTFNLTPHNMVVLLSTLDYHGHSGVNICPTFPGQYFQGGLKTYLMPKENNLKGVHFGIPGSEGWNTGSLTAYTVFRLSWNPNEDVKNIARDFASIYFDEDAAEDLADILLLSPNAYKYGIYIEPVAHGDFRSLPHLRLTTFPVKGFPRLDNGKKHIDFLKTIYLRCQPWKTETLLYLDHGLDVAHSMVEKMNQAKPLISDKKLAEKTGNSIDLTYWLIKTNNLYVKTFFAYFDYRDFPTDENKESLTMFANELRESMLKFKAIPGCVYRLDGMEQLLQNVDQVLTDLKIAEEKLANAPDDDGIKLLISEQQQKSAEILKKYSKRAIKFMTWQGRVDGMDLIHIKANNLVVEHLRYDNIAEMDFQFIKPLPKKNVTVVIKDIQARSFRPFIFEQPNKENDYTVTLYLSDYPKHGYSWWEFDLYYISKPPDELGLAVPW